MNKIILVDANNLMYRVHFSHTGLTDERGYPTGILHGMLSNVLAMQKKYPDSCQLFCWDAGLSWRTALAPNVYKANRVRDAEVTKAVKLQMPLIKHALTRFGFHQFELQSLEADDWIACLAKRFNEDKGISDVQIYSGDRDFYQCIGGKVTVLKPTKDGLKTVRATDVQSEFGVSPWEYALLRSIAGDSSDNYKPVPGIGDKKALSLVRLGANPRLPNFSDHSDYTRSRTAGLKYFWPEIHNCYKLCLLPPKHMPEGLAHTMYTTINNTALNPQRIRLDATQKSQAQKWFYDFTLQYDLADLSKKAEDFWKLR